MLNVLVALNFTLATFRLQSTGGDEYKVFFYTGIFVWVSYISIWLYYSPNFQKLMNSVFYNIIDIYILVYNESAT